MRNFEVMSDKSYVNNICTQSISSSQKYEYGKQQQQQQQQNKSYY
jgi:hypothetical protein